MDLLLSFAPFLGFALGTHTAGAFAGLVAGAVLAALIVLREVARGRKPKILEVATLLLFGGLCVYTLIARPQWSIMGVRLVVDSGLLLIVLFSMLIGRPFTIQYAQESVPREYWNSAEFRRVNYRITAVWALAFAVLVVADVLLLFAPQVPHYVGIVLTVIALAGAMKYTGKYTGKPDA